MKNAYQKYFGTKQLIGAFFFFWLVELVLLSAGGGHGGFVCKEPNGAVIFFSLTPICGLILAGLIYRLFIRIVLQLRPESSPIKQIFAKTFSVVVGLGVGLVFVFGMGLGTWGLC
jgi:hypothetical protein